MSIDNSTHKIIIVNRNVVCKRMWKFKCKFASCEKRVSHFLPVHFLRKEVIKLWAALDQQMHYYQMTVRGHCWWKMVYAHLVSILKKSFLSQTWLQKFNIREIWLARIKWFQSTNYQLYSFHLSLTRIPKEFRVSSQVSSSQ